MINNTIPTPATNVIRYYLKPLDGQFQVYTKDKAEYDKTGQTVEGTLERILIIQDKGQPATKGSFEIAPYNAVLVYLKDNEKQEEYVIRAKEGISFTKSLIEQIMHAHKGDLVNISTRPGDKNNRVSLVSVQRYSSEDQRFVYSPTKIDPEKDYFSVIKSHDAYSEVQTKEADTTEEA